MVGMGMIEAKTTKMVSMRNLMVLTIIYSLTNYGSVFEKRADGPKKKTKYRITVNACANVTGSVKLLLLDVLERIE